MDFYVFSYKSLTLGEVENASDEKALNENSGSNCEVYHTIFEVVASDNSTTASSV